MDMYRQGCCLVAADTNRPVCLTDVPVFLRLSLNLRGTLIT